MGRDALWELGQKPSACLEVSDGFTELAFAGGGGCQVKSIGPRGAFWKEKSTSAD